MGRMTTDLTLQQTLTVLGALAALADQVDEQAAGSPTPCSDFDVAALTGHVVGWLEAFAAGYASPDGQCPPLPTATVPVAEAGPRVRAAAQRLGDAVRAGAAERPLRVGDDAMPGDLALSMILAEYLVHGWDLAVATGQSWQPDPDTCQTSRDFLTGMVTPESRGSGWFGPEVPVPADASPLHRLLGFCGRDPHWVAPTS